MKLANGRKRVWLVWASSVLALVLIATGLILESVPVAARDGMAASYSHGRLLVAIPYHAKVSGTGALTLELLDPDDHVIARAVRSEQARIGKGQWREEFRLTKPLGLEDLVWHRLHYHFDYAASPEGKAAEPIWGIESISQILRTPVVHIFAQQSYLAGSQAAVRIIATDSKNETLTGGSVRIELLDQKSQPRLLYQGSLDRRGTTEAQFILPAGLVGAFTLRYAVDTAIGSTDSTQSVRLEDRQSILLTTEKPIYQPGQTIHVRALVFDRANHVAAADRKLTFEVEDSRGNKVFKKLTKTDEFGIASAEFTLADEVNLGTYHLRAVTGDQEASQANRAELALNVEKYVLPKFKVAVEFSGDQGKAKHGYRPGDHVIGTVRANYFFGKPVDGAEVTVKALGLDVASFEAGSVRGKTGSDGSFKFDIRLPDYFAGRPLSQGAARLLIEASVKDSAEHTETRGQPITVTEAPILITAVPEGGTLVPNLENEVFILTSYADGTPAKAELKVRGAGLREEQLSTDAGGVAVLRLTPGDGATALEVEARDAEGNTAKKKLELRTRDGEEHVLLRTERAVYRSGGLIRLKIFSTRRRGTVYVDIVKDGQTFLTRDLDLEDGSAELVLAATPELAGTVDFSAYLFGRDARPVGDHRLVFVEPADELKIEAVADAPTYKPGDEARIRFRVTNARGEGVRAALGLQIVDEAVFALAEKQPGFAKVFFYLEQELLKPRYEIHSIGMPEIVEPVEESDLARQNRAARALFAATELVNANSFQTEFGRTVPSAKYPEYAARYGTRFLNQARQLAREISRYYLEHPDSGDLTGVVRAMVKGGELDPAKLRDFWGSTMRIEPVTWESSRTYYMLLSPGPDKEIGTGDDAAVYLELRRRRMIGEPRSLARSTIEATFEHDRSPFAFRGEIVGSVVDQTGAAVEGATVTARRLSDGRLRQTRTSVLGRFSLKSLAPGEYDVSISVRGFERVSAKGLELEARDRLRLSVALKGEAAEAVVSVNESWGSLGAFAGERAMGLAEATGFGRGAGGLGDDHVQRAPMPKAAFERQLREDARKGAPAAAPMSTVTSAKDGEAAAPRVRSYFPEALYINPEIITDRDGRASIVIRLADSITTWRMAMVASTARGALGSATSSLKVFQDFFVDLDLPVTLTQGDRVTLPVAVYNYTGARGDVHLELKPEDWYALADDPRKTVVVEADRVGGAGFELEARRIGKFKLTLSARMEGGTERADIVVREIEVVPNGREQSLVSNGRLEDFIRQEVNFPPSAITEASKIFVKLYPGPLSQVIEGMDSILQMPGGCFEQTSSSTYPNVLALDYMKRTKKLTPEIHARAEGFISNGYQRLLTFEVRGGGFSWFGNPPANKILTSYGLMEFYDMSKVSEVDPNLLARTQAWLAGQQLEDGSWKPDQGFINEGATNRYNTDVLRITAYIAWALGSTGYQGPAVERAKQFIGKHLRAKMDGYTLAVLANFAVDYGKDRELTRELMGRLLDARTEAGDQVYWSSEETAVYATGESASIETTGLATQALLKWGQAPNTARKALNYLTAKKNAAGHWGTTQGTIMALRALLLATEKGSADVRGTVEIALNGKQVARFALDETNNDLLHQFVFKDVNEKGPNSVEIKFAGKGGLAYQVAGRYFLPWDEKPEREALSIGVAYERTQLAQNDIALATITVKNNLAKAANMVMVDLGIPPGFDLLSEDLEDYRTQSANQKSGRLQKFSLTATQAILYFDLFAPGETVTLKYRLRAKYPVRAKTFASRVYEYYDPDVQSVARPVSLEVRAK